MWVLLRLLTALVVGLVRFYKRQTAVDERRRSGGIDWVFKQQKSKQRVTSTTFGVAFSHPLFFRLSEEGSSDRFFKTLGFAREFQSGDAAFDSNIYVACDHPAVEPLLIEDGEMRGAILELFRRNAERIYTDGAHLWVHRSDDTLPSDLEVAQLEKIRLGLATLPAESFSALRDRFFWRALFVESVAWSFAFYGLPAVIEIAARPESLYLEWTPVIGLGLVAALVVFVALGFLAWMLLRGSSRAHRVFIESLLVLGIGVPLSSIEMISDANIALDRSPVQYVIVPVESKYTTTSRGRRGRSRSHYHLRLGPITNPPAGATLPPTLTVSSYTYDNTADSGQIRISLHPGALKLPWVEEILPVP